MVAGVFGIVGVWVLETDVFLVGVDTAAVGLATEAVAAGMGVLVTAVGGALVSTSLAEALVDADGGRAFFNFFPPPLGVVDTAAGSVSLADLFLVS